MVDRISFCLFFGLFCDFFFFDFHSIFFNNIGWLFYELFLKNKKKKTKERKEKVNNVFSSFIFV